MSFIVIDGDRLTPETPAGATLPAMVRSAPDLAPRYLDRAALRRQRVPPPELVRHVLAPTLGAPVRIAPGERAMRVVLDAPTNDVEVWLLNRDALPELDDSLYATPPLPGGAELLAGRLARARKDAAGVQGAGSRSAASLALPPEERRAMLAIDADAAYQRALRGVLERVAGDDRAAAQHAIDRVGQRLSERIRSGEGPFVVGHARGPCAPLGVGDTCAREFAFDEDVPPGLYVLLIVRREDSRLFDWQMNAVYASAESERFSFVAAADSQWGDLPEVASAVIGFVALMNASARAGTGPEFIVVAGDIVDCQFGSANSARSKLLGGACDYGRDYVQAWLAFAALRVPIHMTPGNHDGYRFVDAVGATSSDGLFL